MACTFLMLLMLAGCKSNEEPKNITPASILKSSFTLNYNTMQIKGNLSVDKNNKYEVLITSPSALNGLKAVMQNNKLKVSFKGITSNIDVNSLPKTAFIPVMFGSLKEIFESDNLKFKQTDSGYTVNGKNHYGNFNLTLDEECKLTSLSIKEKDFNLNFDK